MSGRKSVIIVGGGISGLSVLHFLRTRKPEIPVTLLEADSRLGGTIGTDHIDGYSFDWGPNGFLDREPLTLQLCRELGLDSQLEPANTNVSKRFICRGGRLREVPMSPPKFLMSDILSWPGKMRLAFEPFARGRSNGTDESIYDFGKRRIGKEAADYLIQPMVSGIFGGMADRLSLKACFPVMYEMETEYGSLMKAMIAKAKKAKADGKKSGGPGGPGGWLTSFHGGLYGIIERFNERYAEFITTSAFVTTITRGNSEYELTLRDGRRLRATDIVLATPAYQAAEMTRPVNARLSSALREIPYAPISVICLGYNANQVKRSLDGFGFLVPAKEKRKILGSIWTSSIFANRAPEQDVQFRVMVGGDGDHLTPKLPDNELLDVVSRELTDIIGLTGQPRVTKIYRWEKGIPQFRIGHGEVMGRIEAELLATGRLHVASNAYYGIGLNDCVKQAFRVAEKI